MLRRTFIHGIAATGLVAGLGKPKAGEALLTAARAQIGVTTSYDPRYVSLPHPNGDLPRSTGVCADVVVRSARDGLGLDLQQLVHEDMLKSFSAYPHIPGMRHPDSNIDHRRVVNLEAFWHRAGCRVWSSSGRTAGDAFPQPLQPGDFITWLLDARLPHVAVVASVSPAQTTVVHNIGYGVQEIALAGFHPHWAAGHFRWPAA